MAIDYRPAESGDREVISELLKQLGYEVTPQQVIQRLQAIRQRQGEVIVASDGRRVIGCINAISDLRLAAGEVGELVSLVVDTEYRGQGIGKALVAEAIKVLKNNGCNRVRVRANILRADAHRFYNSLGFRENKSQKIFLLDLESGG